MKSTRPLFSLARLPVILAACHCGLMIWVLSIWSAGTVGVEAHRADRMVKLFDFPVHDLCQALLIKLLSSSSPAVGRLFDLAGIVAIEQSITRLFWPLLLVAGTCQWLLIGVGLRKTLEAAIRKLAPGPRASEADVQAGRE